MNFIEGYPLPSLEEERNLIEKAQAGDKEAFDYLVLSNSRLVNEVAKRLRGKGIEQEVLFQEGILGLMKAIKKFDLSKEVKLSTYSFLWIQQYMIKTIQNDSRTIRIPCHLYQKNFSLIVETKKLEQELGRSATIEELAEYTNKSIKEIEKFRQNVVDTCSINYICESGREAGEMIADKRVVDVVTEIANVEMLKTIKDILSEKEFRIFINKVGLNDKARTCREIAIDCNLSAQRVQQIYKLCLEKLKNNRKIGLYKCS